MLYLRAGLAWASFQGSYLDRALLHGGSWSHSRFELREVIRIERSSHFPSAVRQLARPETQLSSVLGPFTQGPRLLHHPLVRATVGFQVVWLSLQDENSQPWRVFFAPAMAGATWAWY